MDRIIVIGSSCSGKSTFAKQLANNLNQQYIELDELHWLPNWQERDDSDFRDLVAQKAAQSQWVVDGNYSAARDVLWPRATTIIWLNHSFSLVFYRAITRTIVRVATKKKLFAGNVETFFHSFFSSEAIPWWVLRTFHSKRRNYQKLLAHQRELGITVVELNNQRQVNAYLSGLTTP